MDDFYFDQRMFTVYFNGSNNSRGVLAACYYLGKKLKNNAAVTFVEGVIHDYESDYGSWGLNIKECNFERVEKDLAAIYPSNEEEALVKQIAESYVSLKAKIDKELEKINLTQSHVYCIVRSKVKKVKVERVYLTDNSEPVVNGNVRKFFLTEAEAKKALAESVNAKTEILKKKLAKLT